MHYLANLNLIGICIYLIYDHMRGVQVCFGRSTITRRKVIGNYMLYTGCTSLVYTIGYYIGA